MKARNLTLTFVSMHTELIRTVTLSHSSTRTVKPARRLLGSKKGHRLPIATSLPSASTPEARSSSDSTLTKPFKPLSRSRSALGVVNKKRHNSARVLCDTSPCETLICKEQLSEVFASGSTKHSQFLTCTSIIRIRKPQY